MAAAGRPTFNRFRWLAPDPPAPERAEAIVRLVAARRLAAARGVTVGARPPTTATATSAAGGAAGAAAAATAATATAGGSGASSSAGSVGSAPAKDHDLVGLDDHDLDIYAGQLETRLEELRAQKQKLFSLMKQVIQDEDERQLQRAQAAHPTTAPSGAAPPVAPGHVYLQAGTGHARPPSPSSPRKPDSPQRGAPLAVAAVSPITPAAAASSPWSLKRPADERPPQDHDAKRGRLDDGAAGLLHRPPPAYLPEWPPGARPTPFYPGGWLPPGAWPRPGMPVMRPYGPMGMPPRPGMYMPPPQQPPFLTPGRPDAPPRPPYPYL